MTHLHQTGAQDRAVAEAAAAAFGPADGPA
jgi:hypothetical protein